MHTRRTCGYYWDTEAASSNLMVGDLVWRKDNHQFRSGCSAYATAIVISLDPFALASEDGDMLWASTVKPDEVEAISRAPQAWLDAAMRRLPEVQQRGSAS